MTLEEVIESNKQKFIQLLQIPKREGMDKVIEFLNGSGFFKAPASTKYHNAIDGGLCEHCINVYKQAAAIFQLEAKFKPELVTLVPAESLIIVALLHDICKADVYKKIKKFRKDANNKWEQYDTYDHEFTKMPFGHGEKSVIMLLNLGLKLTEDEMLAIRWHMGAWDISDYSEAKASFNAAADKCPMLSIIMAADSLATRVMEFRGTK